jgi:hypothetical protein
VIKELPQSEKGLHNGAMVRSEEEAGAFADGSTTNPWQKYEFPQLKTLDEEYNRFGH